MLRHAKPIMKNAKKVCEADAAAPLFAIEPVDELSTRFHAGAVQCFDNSP